MWVWHRRARQPRRARWFESLAAHVRPVGLEHRLLHCQSENNSAQLGVLPDNLAEDELTDL